MTTRIVDARCHPEGAKRLKDLAGLRRNTNAAMSFPTPPRFFHAQRVLLHKDDLICNCADGLASRVNEEDA